VLPINRTPHGRSRPLPRRSAWVLACLWLLMVLVPLRAWASAEMMVAMTAPQAAASVTQADSLPPCHAVMNAAHGEPAGPEAETHGATCDCCPFCASALADVSQTAQGLDLALGAARTAIAAAPPSGDPEPFFRPPRA
jgi:hypothetical protein